MDCKRCECVFIPGGRGVTEICASCYKEELAKHINTIDLMKDEFARIKALPCCPEINQICDRAVSEIEQITSVIAQRDELRKALVAVMSELAQWNLTEGEPEAIKAMDIGRTALRVRRL